MTSVYHITHVDNLASIVATGSLLCDNARARGRLESVGIAHAHIKARRAKKTVPIGPGGTLAQYVPFYFAPRSPMLYAIHTGSVEGYTGGQSAVLHLRAEAERAAEAGYPFVFADGHAEMSLSTFHDDLADLDQIDWAVMQGRYWNDTIDDPDRKRRRQAEFLVHRSFPWPLIIEIGVADRATKRAVDAVLSKAHHRPAVEVRREWYY